MFTDTNNLVLYANDALTGQFGYQPHELRGQSIAVLHADGRIDRASTLERVTTVYRRRDGQKFYGEMQRSVVKGERGELIGHLEVIHDISERIVAERALKAGERRYQGVLEAVPYPLWVTGQHDEVEYRNAKYQQVFGDALLRDLLHPEDRPALEQAWQRSRFEGQPLAMELRLAAAQSYRYFTLVGAPMQDAGGEISQWVFSVSDIHDRLQAERMAVHNEERYRGVIEGMPQMVWLTNERGEPTYFNRRWHDYVGTGSLRTAFCRRCIQMTARNLIAAGPRPWQPASCLRLNTACWARTAATTPL